MEINTIEYLRRADPEYIRQQFSIVLERIVKELNGIPCIELEKAGAARQQIMVSGSFGQLVVVLGDEDRIEIAFLYDRVG